MDYCGAATKTKLNLPSVRAVPMETCRSSATLIDIIERPRRTNQSKNFYIRLFDAATVRETTFDLYAYCLTRQLCANC